jgi:flagellin
LEQQPNPPGARERVDEGGFAGFRRRPPLSISVNTTNPILAALQELNAAGQPAGDASLIEGPGSSGTSDPATGDAVNIGQGGSLDLTAVDADAMSLNRATSIADLAVGAGQSVASLLATLKDQAAAAVDPSLDPAARQTVNSDFKSVLGQIASTVDQASFDGVNLLDGESPTGLNLPASAGAGLSLSAQNLTLGGPIVTLAATSSLGTPSAAASALADVTNSLSNIETALNALSDQASQISAHGSIVGQLSGALQAGTTANGSASADGARLLALQVQQQLGAQSQPIANQSPQLVLSLFR